METVEDMVRDGRITGVRSDQAVANLIKALGKGVMKVMSRVRMDGASAARPERAISRNEASEVSSQHRNSTTASSVVTRPTMARVNIAMPR